jgi:glycosyltransferase involved in cell wall biosynthesis
MREFLPPKLSIITINLNNAPGLRKTIESVVSQTNRNFEYIIIDGGSTDTSVEVIKSFTNIPQGIYTKKKESFESENLTKQEYYNQIEPLPEPLLLTPTLPKITPITYWVSESDYGIYHAMNKGIRIAKGEFCQFLNAGDFLVSVDITKKMLNDVSGYSILIGNMLKLFIGGEIYQDKGIGAEKPTFMTFYRGTLNHSSAYIKRNLFDKYGFYDETLKIVSDWKWYLIAVGLNNESTKYLDIDVSCMEMNGISHTNQALVKEERRKVLGGLLPVNILADYDAQWMKIDQVNRINHYTLTKWFFWFIERVLFKLEKWKIL